MVDLLVKGGIIVTMNDKRSILEGHAIAIDRGKIVAIGPESEIQREHRAEKVVDASNSIVMPGLICSHTHLYGMLLRGASLGITPPSDFTQILQRVWWPVDEALTYDDAYASALVGCLEFLKTGTTLFADTYSGPNSIEGVLDRIAKAVDQVGIRGLVAFEATERHSRDEGMRGVQENVRFAQSTRERSGSKAMPLLSIHASFTVTDELIRHVRELASRLRVPITVHASEGMVDVHHNMEHYGKRTLERLRDSGLLGPDVVLAHCVQLEESEIDIIAQSGAKVAHNPMSNMLNAVGVAPLTRMLNRGVTVGLGNDGYIFDGFENMRATYLLHRVHQRNPNAIDPYTVLEMATIRGAELYGLQKELGSIEVGKNADIITIKPSVLPTPLTPQSVIGHLINSVNGDDVETVIVDGKPLVIDKRVLTVDVDEAQRISQACAAKLWERLSKITPQVDILRPPS